MTARDRSGRFAKDDGSRPATAAEIRDFTDFSYLVPARDLEETGVRAVLAKHFPTWDLSENPPLFDEALAAVEAAS